MVDFGVIGIGPGGTDGEDALLGQPDFSKAQLG
jgi:aconitase A